jgi:hypothetical protein
MIHRYSLLPWLLPAVVAAQAPATATLEGVVVGPLLQPVPACAIVIEADGQQVAATRTDASGYFVAGRVPALPVVVRAIGEGVIGAGVVDMSGGARTFLRIATWPTRSLRGRVTTAAGEPVAGAWVQATPTGSPDLARADCFTRSDANGEYHLAHVLLGATRVLAWAEGHGCGEAVVDGVADRELALELAAEDLREVAFVLRGATPAQLADAELALSAEHADGSPTRLPLPLRSLRPDAAGRCVVRGWSANDRLFARFTIPGVAIDPAIDFAPKVARQWECGFDVRPAAPLRGIVRDDRGKPLAGAWLLVRPADSRERDAAAVAVQSGADGGFLLTPPVAAGERCLVSLCGGDHVLVAPDEDAGAWPDCHRLRHDGSSIHELSARRCEPVLLRVVDAAGAPVHAAAVSLRRHLARSSGFGRVATARRVGTDRRGIAEFHGIGLHEPGSLSFTVEALAGIADASVPIGDGAAIDLLVTLRPPVPFCGVVRSADGKPCGGVRVVVRRVDRDLFEVVVVSDRDGRFAVGGLREGQYSVSIADAPAQRTQPRNVGGAGITDLELIAR